MAKSKKKMSLEKVIELSRTELDNGNKIAAIQIVRQHTDMGLVEAKLLVETYNDSTSCRKLAARWKAISNGDQPNEPVEQVALICGVCQRPWIDGKCSGGFINHKAA